PMRMTLLTLPAIANSAFLTRLNTAAHAPYLQLSPRCRSRVRVKYLSTRGASLGESSAFCFCSSDNLSPWQGLKMRAGPSRFTLNLKAGRARCSPNVQREFARKINNLAGPVDAASPPYSRAGERLFQPGIALPGVGRSTWNGADPGRPGVLQPGQLRPGERPSHRRSLARTGRKRSDRRRAALIAQIVDENLAAPFCLRHRRGE